MTTNPPLPVSKAALWSGRILSGLIVAAMLAAAAMSLSMSKEVVENSEKSGVPAATIRPIGVALAISALLYAIPQTAVLGAILLTGYFGGAVFAHTRLLEYPVIPVPVIFGALTWLGLFLRDPRLRALIPIRTSV